MLPRIDSIKQIRQKIGITQKKLATMTGVSISMINQIESGEVNLVMIQQRKFLIILQN